MQFSVDSRSTDDQLEHLAPSHREHAIQTALSRTKARFFRAMGGESAFAPPSPTADGPQGKPSLALGKLRAKAHLVGVASLSVATESARKATKKAVKERNAVIVKKLDEASRAWAFGKIRD